MTERELKIREVIDSIAIPPDQYGTEPVPSSIKHLALLLRHLGLFSERTDIRDIWRTMYRIRVNQYGKRGHGCYAR